MDLHNSYRMQQCTTDNITDIRVVMEQSILKRNIFKNAACIGGEKKKLCGKKLPSSDHLFWKSAHMTQTNIERRCFDGKWGLSNDDWKKAHQNE